MNEIQYKLLYIAKEKIRSKRGFTLIELSVSMGLLLILILGALLFFNSSQNIMEISSSNADAFENAKITMELILRDLQSMYYQNNYVPFWHKPETSDTTEPQFNNEALSFIASTSSLSSVSPSLCEIKYTLWYDNNTPLTDSAGWVMRSVTDNSSQLFNYSGNSLVGYRHNTASSQQEVFTANNDSSAAYSKQVPYVISLTFSCLRKDGTLIGGSDTSTTELPYSIQVILTVLNRTAWAKWIALGGTPEGIKNSTEPTAAATYRQHNQKTFTKTILMSNKGSL